MKADKKKRIAVDLDGTLTKQGKFNNIWDITPMQLIEYYENVEPNKDMIELVNKLYDKGYTIYIFTSRSNLYQRQTKDWMDKNNIKHHYFITDKPYYDVFIDDKAIHPEVALLWEKNL